MNRTPQLIICFIFALFLAPSARLAYAGEPAAFQLQPETKVDGTGIFLNQVMALPFHPDRPITRLAPAPPWGQTNSISRQQIIALAKEAAPELNTTNWSGPELVCIILRVRQLCEADVTEMLRV